MPQSLVFCISHGGNALTSNVVLEHYEAGHMMYVHEPSLAEIIRSAC